MNYFSINWPALAVAVVISMINGGFYYNPKTFFPAWWKVVGNGKETPGGQNMAMVWILTIVAAAAKAYFIAVAVNIIAPAFGGMSWQTGLMTGLFLWGGFVAPTYLVNKMFAGHGIKVWLIEVGNHLIDFLLFGALFGLWR